MHHKVRRMWAGAESRAAARTLKEEHFGSEGKGHRFQRYTAPATRRLRGCPGKRGAASRTQKRSTADTAAAGRRLSLAQATPPGMAASGWAAAAAAAAAAGRGAQRGTTFSLRAVPEHGRWGGAQQEAVLQIKGKRPLWQEHPLGPAPIHLAELRSRAGEAPLG